MQWGLLILIDIRLLVNLMFIEENCNAGLT